MGDLLRWCHLAREVQSGCPGRIGMYRQSAFLFMDPFSMVWSTSGAPADWAYQKRQPKAKTDGGSLTGCVDGQDGPSVLVDERILAPIANSEKDGFRAEGFAKHLGNRLRVRVTINSSGARPLVKVPSSETVSHAGGCQELRE